MAGRAGSLLGRESAWTAGEHSGGGRARPERLALGVGFHMVSFSGRYGVSDFTCRARVLRG